ncbi:MAG: nuclear transport factor 2 family protein [Actinobacteria bacterium]|nr:nuclear transport factor 2 family protein [Actinomycetota bacterium]
MEARTGPELLEDGPVRRMVDAANRHDLDAMVEEFAEDYENVTPIHPAQSFTGRSQVRKNWERLFRAVPDLRVTVHNATTGPDRTVWMEWGNGGTRVDGVPVQMVGVAIFTVRSDRIAGVRFYLEPLDTAGGDVDAAVGEVTSAPGSTALAAQGRELR